MGRGGETDTTLLVVLAFVAVGYYLSAFDADGLRGKVWTLDWPLTGWTPDHFGGDTWVRLGSMRQPKKHLAKRKTVREPSLIT